MSFLAAEIIEEAADKTEYKWNSIFNKSKNKKGDHLIDIFPFDGSLADINVFWLVIYLISELKF